MAILVVFRRIPIEPTSFLDFLKRVTSRMGPSFLTAEGRSSVFDPDVERELCGPWLVHGGTKTQQELPVLLPMMDRRNSISEQEFNYFLTTVADTFAWALLPWGAFESFEMFAFVSSNPTCLDAFHQVILADGGISVLSRIENATAFVSKARALMYFENYESKANGIWQLGSSGTSPYALFAPPVHRDSLGKTTVKLPPSLIAELTCEATFRDRHTQNPSVYPLGFALYRVGSRNALYELCRGHEKRVIVFGACDVHSLGTILSPQRSFYQEELPILVELSDLSGWSYGVNCGGEDWPIDAFVGNAPAVAQRFKRLAESESVPFMLTSFF